MTKKTKIALMAALGIVAALIATVLTGNLDGVLQQALGPANEPPASSTDVVATPVEPEAQAPAGADVAERVIPVFDLVRVEPTGDAVIAGQGAPESEVEIVSGSDVIATGKANTSGEWAVVLDTPLPSGAHDIKVRSKTEDGTEVVSEQSVAVSVPEEGEGEVLVVLNAPGTPSEVLQVPGADDVQEAIDGAAAEDVAEAQTPAEAGEETVAAAEAPSGEGSAGGESVVVADEPAAGTPADEAPPVQTAERPPEPVAEAEPEAPAATAPPVVTGTDPPTVEEAARPETAEPSAIAEDVPADGAADPAGGAPAAEVVAAAREPEAREPDASTGTADAVETVADSGPVAAVPDATVPEAAEPDAGEPDVEIALAPAVEAPGGDEPVVGAGETYVPADPVDGADDVAAPRRPEPAAGTPAGPGGEESTEPRPAVGQGTPESPQVPDDPPAAVADDADAAPAVADAPSGADAAPAVPDAPAGAGTPSGDPDDAGATQETTVAALQAEEPAPTPVQVTIEAVELENGNRFFAAGAAGAGATLRLYVDDGFFGEIRAMDSGRWLVDGTLPLEPGDHRVRVDQIGRDGTVLSRAEVPFEILEELVAGPIGVSGSGSVGAGTGISGVARVGDAQTLIIRRGDNLWRIARRLYGQGVRYSTIYQANTDQIVNPDLIFPGQVFVVPQGDRNWEPGPAAAPGPGASAPAD